MIGSDVAVAVHVTVSQRSVTSRRTITRLDGPLGAGVAAHLGVCSSVAAELYTIRIGLSLELKFGYSCIICEVDAKVFCHTYREGNFYADALAKMGCSLEDDLLIFQSSPTDVSAFLEADSRGGVFTRL
ncbi:hypothetical protein F3Y22_tig00111308pilonHSYRG00016 [Hibiscus syriacus]|uniref:RNase H type-1 domain-containing protein n=1 Tax=Hibiscus syriacus TaxID=106335 RepID=A0A6A2YQW1_HIBSY|nr:hypothetical protein F3Y22_tig00111308pilonHSYRG00016 [Hibiscus syriacus]